MELQFYGYDFQTSVGKILPWFGKMHENLTHYPDGCVSVDFDHNGIVIRYGDVSEETIPKSQLEVFSELYEEYRYQVFASRHFRYSEIEEIQNWLAGYSDAEPITISLDTDKGNVGIKLGGELKFFGEA